MSEEKPKTFLKTFLLILVTAIVSISVFCGILALYIMKENPFNIKACVISSFLGRLPVSGEESEKSDATEKKPADTNTKKTYDNPLLSDSQEKMLESAGIDISTLPTSITPEMRDCFIEKLGEKRVDEIIGGSTPGPLEILRAKSCL